MPSPLAHGAVAFVLEPALRTPEAKEISQRRRWLLGGAIVVGACAPDVDFIPHLLWSDQGRIHGQATHSLLAGAVFGGLFAVVARWIAPISWIRLWIVGTLAWWSHVLLDALTYQGGVALLWPFSAEAFSAPVPLFYGVRHSEPWAWHLHLITLVTELPFVAAMWGLGRWMRGRSRTDPHSDAATARRESQTAQPTGDDNNCMRGEAQEIGSES